MIINGKVGEGSAMHTLQLITDSGETLSIAIDDDTRIDCKNGLVIGEHISVNVTLSAISITEI
ncbi:MULTISPECIES: hypothetical protein [Clostridium]|uniref:Uncharacterized protein n=1 Tax=Clostridium cibarium TaxID=2762247 RepID=A0ABR8PVL6_9CLOT|nr:MULTISPECIES: hypothetical protein [Clostridium]MBD7912194.1 hypothetical protein [Clostridium cibarium]